MPKSFKPESSDNPKTGYTSLDSSKDQSPKNKPEISEEETPEQNKKNLEHSTPEV